MKFVMKLVSVAIALAVLILALLPITVLALDSWALDLVGTPRVIAVRETVTFTNLTEGGNLPYQSVTWNFGDGTIVTYDTSPEKDSGGTVMHTYMQPGEYIVCITIVDGLGFEGTTCKGVPGDGYIKLGDVLVYYRGYSDNPYVVDTLDLLKAADDWIAGVVPPHFTEPITTLQLLALADEWQMPVSVLPCRFYGTVQLNGADVADGTIITVVIDGDEYTTTTPAAAYGPSTYAIMIQPSGYNKYPDGTWVAFEINGLSAQQIRTWTTGGNIEANLTRGAVPSPTPMPTPTPTVLFSDDFSNPYSGWTTGFYERGWVEYQNGWLHIENYTDSSHATHSELHQHFSDFAIEVETRLVAGTDNNWHLVACRMIDAHNYYIFGISADGYYTIDLWHNDVHSALSGLPTWSSYINKGWGVTNLMRVECEGSTLRLYANGYLLSEVNDGTLSNGYIGLVACSLAGSYSEVAFDNLVVTSITSQ